MKPYSKMNSNNTILLVIDVINSCVHEKCEIPEWDVTFSNIRKMIPNLETFIQRYRKTLNSKVIFTRTVPWQKKFLPDNLNELYTDPKATYYTTDTSDFPQKFYQLTPQTNDLVIDKNSYDAFANETLINTLSKDNIKYIVVAGIFGDGCVMASICGGFSRGFNFIILEDLIETTDVPIRQALLKNLKEFTWPTMYGKTLNSKEFLDDWEEDYV